MEQEWVAYSFNYPLVVIYSGFKTYVTDLLPLKKESNNLICLKRVLNLTATYSHTILTILDIVGVTLVYIFSLKTLKS